MTRVIGSFSPERAARSVQHAGAAYTIIGMQPQEIARLIEEKLGAGSTVVVVRETPTSFELRIEKAGRTYLRSVVGESPETFDSSVAERIATSIPR